ncbi:cytochrome-c peroxidase [Neolewinella sp.]|uniref:cytochrome-c peroxidase n=1 Tax=Neolewinella sp. TaxID=2993543 RepID=UPI003B517C13
MRYLPLILLLLPLTACLDDERLSPDDANPVTPFTAEERAVLQQTLTIGDETFQQSVQLPLHIAQTMPITGDFNNGPSRTMDLEPRDLTKALLGRVLFYDTQLSATGETSCATCHQQKLAFGDNLAFSKGINGHVTKRNSIALGSVPTFAQEVSGYGETSFEQDFSTGNDIMSTSAGSVAFFWDERARTIKDQSTITIQDNLEMGRDLDELAADLRRQDMYRILTRKAYGTDDLTPERITLALEKFCATITSMDTRFDELIDVTFTQPMEEWNQSFSSQELQGMELFNMNCAGCHGSTLTQPNQSIANNGLDLEYTDQGVGALHNDGMLNGVFKVPFLRNVALTAPYMHDGRFATLREVVDHYSEGIQQHPNLNLELQEFDQATGQTHLRRMNFTEEEKQALVTFLELATDRSVTTDPRLSDPFK